MQYIYGQSIIMYRFEKSLLETLSPCFKIWHLLIYLLFYLLLFWKYLPKDCSFNLQNTCFLQHYKCWLSQHDFNKAVWLCSVSSTVAFSFCSARAWLKLWFPRDSPQRRLHFKNDYLKSEAHQNKTNKNMKKHCQPQNLDKEPSLFCFRILVALITEHLCCFSSCSLNSCSYV